MGYYVKKLDWKKSTPNWKIQYISYKKKHSKESNAKKPKKEWDIPRFRWAELGVNPSMNLLEARERAKQLNAIEKAKLIEARQQVYAMNRRQFEQEVRAIFPELFREQFEARYVYGPSDRKTLKSSRAQWAAAQRMLRYIALDPADWFEHAHDIYDYFVTKRLSLSYCQKILRFANLWGFFISRKLGKPFLPIPYPRGREKARIQEAYYSKHERQKLESDPITPTALKKVKHNIYQSHYNWLYLSVWLGLRPKEVDQLHQSHLFRVETLPCGTKVLWVFQTKLTSIPRERRWKPIPLIFREQSRIVRIIKTGNFKRPLAKSVKRLFGDRTTLYGGRKGFTDLMIAKGQSLENISQWLGHRSIERTWRSYKDTRVVHFHKV